MTHRFIAPKPRTTRAEALSAHQKALNDLLEVSQRQGARQALEMALALAKNDPCAAGIANLLDAVRLSLGT